MTWNNNIQYTKYDISNNKKDILHNTSQTTHVSHHLTGAFGHHINHNNRVTS